MSTSERLTPWDLPVVEGVDAVQGSAHEGPGAWALPDLGPAGVAGGSRPAPREHDDPAYLRGREAGLREAAARAEERTHHALDALRRVTESLAASRTTRLSDLEANLYAIALVAARKIVMREVADDPTIVRDLVRRALEQLGPDSPLEVRLHPEDLKVVEEGIAITPGDPIQEIRWKADPSLERGSFFLEGTQRIVDGRVDDALRVLYQRLDNE